jgi:hypothetical protein
MFREFHVRRSPLLTDFAICMNYYRLFSPGLYCCIHTTVELDDGTGGSSSDRAKTPTVESASRCQGRFWRANCSEVRPGWPAVCPVFY